MEYLHGFEKKEQDRLIYQAKILEPILFKDIKLAKTKNLLEVGCGVGAQTQILLRRFPKIKITGVDLSEAQLHRAQNTLKSAIKNRRVQLFQQDAQELNLDFKKFDSAFVCWFLEHVPDPVKVLRQTYKHLKPGSTIYLTEVFNQSLFMDPYAPAYLKYWYEFNDLQWEMKGHPFIGVQLGHYLKEAGFKNIKVEFIPLHFDSRTPKRRSEFVEYFFDILLSAEEKLLKAGRVDKNLIAQMRLEVERVKTNTNSVFFYSFARATATR